jgi:molecular chaperone IbpA
LPNGSAKTTRLIEGDGNMMSAYITDPFATLDRMFAVAKNTTPGYPPYNVIKFNDNEYSLQFAVAGFKKPDIDITVENGILKISGKSPEPQFEDGAGYVHKGIAARKFARSFTIPEYFEVDWAGLEDGILSIGLTRNIPEEKQPKKITIE